MAMGEDLLLLAIHPRRGTIRAAERIAFALRAGELVDLALAGRVTIKGRRIKIADTAATGNGRLDTTLAAIGAMRAPTVQAWVQGAPRGLGTQYPSRLADQRAVRVGDWRHAALPTTVPGRCGRRSTSR